MTDWKADLDALVQETMAFTKSIRVEEPTMPRTVVEPNRMPPVNLDNSERDEIRRRVSNFKAHQDRFARERDDYAAAQLKRMLGRSGPGRNGQSKPMREKGWSREFEDPTTCPRCAPLITFSNLRRPNGRLRSEARASRHFLPTWLKLGPYPSWLPLAGVRFAQFDLPRRDFLAFGWSLKSDAALTCDACLFKRIHFAIGQGDLVRSLLVADVRRRRPDDHDRWRWVIDRSVARLTTPPKD
jgi:hypothetical protein